MNASITAQTRPAGLAAGLTLIVGTILLALNVADPSAELASAIAVLIVGAVSYFAPRSSGFPRPVGLTAAAATVLVWAAGFANVAITPELALTLVTIPSVIISIFTPRTDAADAPDEGNGESAVRSAD